MCKPHQRCADNRSHHAGCVCRAVQRASYILRCVRLLVHQPDVYAASLDMRATTWLCMCQPHRSGRHTVTRSYDCRSYDCDSYILDSLSSRRDALVLALMMPFFGVWPSMMSMCSHRPNRTFIPLSPLGRVIVQVEMRSLCAYGTRCPSLASDRRRRCALAVHIGRLFRRSRHGAGRSYKSRCARCALKVLDALLWRRTAAAAVCSRRPHRTFYSSRDRAGRSYKSRRAHCALIVLDALL
jgi:hypothetical protein